MSSKCLRAFCFAQASLQPRAGGLPMVRDLCHICAGLMRKAVIMKSEDWRAYAAALDDATRGLEAFSRRLQHQAGEDQRVAQRWGVLGYRGLYEAHRKLLRDLEEQAHQAGLKHETS